VNARNTQAQNRPSAKRIIIKICRRTKQIPNRVICVQSDGPRSQAIEIAKHFDKVRRSEDGGIGRREK
jgi:hypothetical protein